MDDAQPAETRVNENLRDGPRHARELGEVEARAAALSRSEKELLEMIARGQPLQVVLDRLCLLLEEHTDCRSSILLTSDDGLRLMRGAAPTLPPAFTAALNDVAISPPYGPCAFAVSERRPIVMDDLSSEPRLDGGDYRSLALAHGLRACWSVPILASAGHVLGTFALYHDVVFSPGPAHEELLSQLTHLASIAIERDAAERRFARAQAELARVTRVTTLGELAASIAHEVNQPLSAIAADARAALHWLEQEPAALEPARESLRAIESEAARAGRVLSRIRTLLARKQPDESVCDLAEVLSAVVPIARAELSRHGLGLQVDCAHTSLSVAGDSVELQQVLLNLLLNAAEASREVPLERRRVRVGSWVERDDAARCWAVVVVEDAGIGLAQHDPARLFSAFYTTKPGGLGMGLSIARSIVERHGGRITARANVSHGATFQFALPVADVLS